MECGGRLLLARGGLELGHGLGALGDGVLGELAGEDEADGRLDLARPKRLRLREAADVRGLVADALEEVRDEVAHDSHALGRDARVRVHLLDQDPEQEVSVRPQSSSFSTTPFFFSYPLA